jgi:hypothetical protein
MLGKWCSIFDRGMRCDISRDIKLLTTDESQVSQHIQMLFSRMVTRKANLVRSELFTLLTSDASRSVSPHNYRGRSRSILGFESLR